MKANDLYFPAKTPFNGTGGCPVCGEHSITPAYTYKCGFSAVPESGSNPLVGQIAIDRIFRVKTPCTVAEFPKEAIATIDIDPTPAPVVASGRHKCVCGIQTLLIRGCICGGI